MATDLLRRAVGDLNVAVERLHLAYHQCDPDTLRSLLDDFDLINADMHIALEELNACPPTPVDDEAGQGGVGGTGQTS